MLKEISIASSNIADYLTPHCSLKQVQDFKLSLSSLLAVKFKQCWVEQEPLRGSAFRAINIIDSQFDPILNRAAAQIGINLDPDHFPAFLGTQHQILFSLAVVWIDPLSVSYRMGDYGYPKSIYDGNIAMLVKASPATPSTFATALRDRMRTAVIAH